MERYLVLEDGSFYQGEALGSDHFRTGDLIFNTSMTGYQEIITDSANAGMMVVMTYPLIGAYGINREDNESLHPALSGLIVRTAADKPSNFRSEETLESYLKRMDIPAVQGVDTRAIVRRLREKGTMRAGFCSTADEIPALVETLKAGTQEEHPVRTVSTRSTYPVPGRSHKVVVIDYGVRLSTLRACAERDYDLIVVPYNTDAETILSYHPAGVLLSTGPGNPADLRDEINTVKELLPQTTVFGTGLGAEILGLACGAEITRLPHGHHGPNQAVVDCASEQVIITHQNHNYALDRASLEAAGLIMTHRSLNDESVEGFAHPGYACCGREYEPDDGFFDAFEKAMRGEEKYA
ncbi:MAG: glutamine-hydrolyzing carbamoyl-phosphate synthase small subunit [Solobacterium sp.]|nr:glutamine-hydrolyzing carbamoyl-phosphate synthase small subunit [Solobacterium sp.]MBR0477859.1 glutamine-hydrolyzing carbamoyl-phosphate synthase small subunit [Solobacterium sp.]